MKEFTRLIKPPPFDKPSRDYHSVFFPTDLSGKGDTAFYHALKIALCNKCELDIVNVTRKKRPARKRRRFPGIRPILERWGILEAGSSGEAVQEKLGIKIRKVRLVKPSRVNAMLRFMKREPSDLIVLVTKGGTGWQTYLRPSVAERLARRAKTPALILPRGTRGFVSVDDGSARLDRVLVTCVGAPNAQPAMDTLSHLIFSTCTTPPRTITLHVKHAGETPTIVAPEPLAASVEQEIEHGETAAEIISLAESRSAELIVMATEAPKGLRDRFLGTTTEQVVRRATCPVLAVPINQSRVINIRY